MNSTLKPVLPQPGVPQTAGQSSPAKGNVATANHTVGLPQGAQNSLHHGTNNLVVQNLTHHVPNTPQLPPHPVPSMAPVTANMAQMAQNMSHHGNLSHVTQNSITPTNMAVSPSKSASTSAPLSLVQDKANTSQPLALTRTPDKKETEAAGQANGIESPKSSSVPAPLKPQNPELKQDKQDIAKTSPSTPKPPEKPTTPSTPQKVEPSPPPQAESPAQPKVATANEAPEKSPSKPIELTPAPAADVAPTQSDSKPVPESASDNQVQEKTPLKETAPAEVVKPVEEKQEVKEEVKDKPVEKEEKKEEEPKEPEPVKPEPEKAPVEEKVEEKKVEKPPAKPEVKATPKSTLKLATVTPPMRKRRQLSDKSEGPPAKKAADESTPDSKSKRNRTKVQLYQSPTPEIAMATKLSASAGRSTPTKPNDDKLIVFYKNEYLAVRNAEGGFYVCQAMQNVYRTTRKIKIRWLSMEKSDSNGETYKPDFYDTTDMECVLTTLSMSRTGGGAGGGQLLKAAERERATSILERALRVEQGGDVELTAEHPDGLDLSLYTDESQIEKKSRKRNSSKSSPRAAGSADATAEKAVTPSKKARTTPKRSPKSVRKAKPKPKTPPNKRKSVGSTQSVATTKTATAVTEKATKAKTTPSKSAKKTPKPAKVETPVSSRKGRRAAKESPAPTPSTSSGKPSRSSRKTSY